jgi:hypothetical protein
LRLKYPSAAGGAEPNGAVGLDVAVAVGVGLNVGAVVGVGVEVAVGLGLHVPPGPGLAVGVGVGVGLVVGLGMGVGVGVVVPPHARAVGHFVGFAEPLTGDTIVSNVVITNVAVTARAARDRPMALMRGPLRDRADVSASAIRYVLSVHETYRSES